MNDQALAAVERLAEGWSAWMLEMSLQVAVLATVVAVLTWVWRRRSASFRYALWLVVLARLATPPSLALPTGWGWWLRGEAASEVAVVEAQLPTVAPSGQVETSVVAANSPPDVETIATAPATTPLPASQYSSLAPVAAPKPAPAAPVSLAPSWAALLMIGWSGVSLTLLSLLVLGGVRTRRWVRQASPTLDPRLARILDGCRRRLHVTQDIGLRNSENCTTPLVVGWRRPVILLPACVPQQLEDEELEAVVLHELHHVLRRDALVNFGQAVLGALYFFHPLVWWANAHLYQLREDACDELTVAALEGRRRAYGSALVKVSTILGYAAPPLALGVLESPHPAKRRLGRILDPNLPVGERRGGLSVGLAILLAVVFLPGGPRPAPSLGDETVKGAAASKPPFAEMRPKEAESPVVNANPAAPEALETKPWAHDTSPPELRYVWRLGESLAYSINIEAQNPEGVDTGYGNAFYNVRGVDGPRVTLTFHGSLHGFRRPHFDWPFTPFAPSFDVFPHLEGAIPAGFPQERTVTVNSQGRVESVRGGVPLPFALGDLARLVFVPLPAAGEREWRISAPSRIEFADRVDPRFARSAFLRPTPEMLEAEESQEFRLASWSDAEAVITRKMHVASLQMVGEKPRITVAGEGDAVFDRQAGAVRSLRWRLTIVAHEPYTNRQTEVTVVCQRLETKAPAVEPKKLGLTQAVADLDAETPERVLEALRALQQTEPNGDRATVAARLVAFLDHENATIRDAGAKALTRWAGSDDAPTLITLLEDESTSVRWAAMEALGRLRSESAIAPLARRLAVGIDRVSAGRALAQIGPAAESTVLAVLNDGDATIRLFAVNLLRDIGGAASLAPLTKLRDHDSQENIRTWARLAIERIEQRLNE